MSSSFHSDDTALNTRSTGFHRTSSFSCLPKQHQWCHTNVLKDIELFDLRDLFCSVT